MDAYFSAMSESFQVQLMLLPANLIFWWRFDRKTSFLPRFVITWIGCIMLNAVMHLIDDGHVILISGTYLVTLLTSILIAHTSFVISWSDSVFCAVAGYSAQFILSTSVEFLFRVLHFPFSWLIPCRIIAMLLIYPLIYLFFGRQIKRGQNLDLNKKAQFFLLFAAVMTEILLCTILRRSWRGADAIYIAGCILLLLICAIAILTLQFSLLVHKRLARELDILYQMRRKEETQYALSRETIDTINRKCHDMRHQIHSIGSSARIDPQALREMENAIDIYESMYKTGSHALDIILTEKSLLCQNNGIVINCMADGNALDFISDTDIYSLFGNLLENAINAVQDLEPEQRLINLTIRQRGSLLSINSYNRYAGQVLMENGMPVTASSDTMNRGFGVKSIAMIVEKYGGTTSFQAEDGLFNLNILFYLDTDA